MKYNVKNLKINQKTGRINFEKKVVGPVDIPIEIMELLNNRNIKLITALFTNIYNTG